MGVELVRHANVVELRLDWPDSRNALGAPEGQELGDAVISATRDAEAHAVVLSSTGPAFCAGGHLKSLVDVARKGPQAVRDTVYTIFHRLFNAIEDSEVPVIAAVDGAATGLGADLALSADVTFIGERGWLHQGWMRMGVIPATGGTEFVRRRAGRAGVWRFLTADRVDARTAEAMRLAIAADNARDAALAMAAAIGAMPREQVAAVRRLSTIEDIRDHRAAALDYQMHFLSSDFFIASARAALAQCEGK